MHPVSHLESARRFLPGLKSAGFSSQNIVGEGLIRRSVQVVNELFLTACAGAMMSEFGMRRKVRCHNGSVEKSAALIAKRRR